MDEVSCEPVLPVLLANVTGLDGRDRLLESPSFTSQELVLLADPSNQFGANQSLKLRLNPRQYGGQVLRRVFDQEPRQVVLGSGDVGYLA